jgi:hypothetical protein
MMDNAKLCAICQRPSTKLICGQCHEKWDLKASWVKDLRMLEDHWRKSNDHETQLFPVHISVDGHPHDSDAHWLPDSLLAEDHWLDDEDLHIFIQAIDKWAISGGLTIAEQHAYQLMKTGVGGTYATQVINDMESKHLSHNAFIHRAEIVIHKIQNAVKAGIIIPED